MVWTVSKYPVGMSQKRRKVGLWGVKKQKNSRESMPQTSLEVGNRSAFDLDLRLS